MHIDEYGFGRIVIGGVVYTQDVIAGPDEVRSPWWRARGHLLSESDLTGLPPDLDVLVIGTGAHGRMRVPEELLQRLRSRIHRAEAISTDRAVIMFNELSGPNHRVCAALHLTC